MEIVIYRKDNGRVGVISPAPGIGIETAVAAVPEGRHHRIIDVADLPAATEWIWSDDGPILPAPPTVAAYTAAIDAHVEATARGRNYNSAAHLASYAASTVPAWAAEAGAFVAWRDAVWQAAIALLDAVEAGGGVPSIEDVVAGLPVIAWPA